MVITLPPLLALFSLLALSSAVYFLAGRLRMPYTVLLVAVGAFLVAPLSSLPSFAFLRSFEFTPEILFYLFLPVLIFESAYNFPMRRMLENIRAISALAVVSLLLSATTISLLLYYLLPFIGYPVPFIVCALFGTLISATDPVAVLALFKEIGAPRRLTLLFEGESIFNDGTAVALFVILLAIAGEGWYGNLTLLEGVTTFVTMVLTGILLGLVLGVFFVKAVDAARSSEYVQISLMIVLAHFTFIISDYFSQHFTIAGHPIHVSAIISTAVASMVMGNYGQAKILPHARDFVEKFWTESALLANSLVFLLMGLMFTTLPVRLLDLMVPIFLAVLVVAVARAVSIYPVTVGLNLLTREARIPASWQHLLAWGSLRGALAITMVLLIPEDFAVAGWVLAETPREFIMALTIGCIFATLFIKATTIQSLARRLHTNDLTDLERLQYGEATALVHAHALSRLTKFRSKGYIDADTADTLTGEHNARLEAALSACESHLSRKGEEVGERVLRLYALGIEKNRLADLYEYGEVTEDVYRRTHTKLTLQYERIETGSLEADPAPSISTLLTERARRLYRKLCSRRHSRDLVVDRYTYYRTLVVLSRTVLRELKGLDQAHCTRLFGSHAIAHISAIYESFLEGAGEKMKALEQEMPDLCQSLSEHLARKSVLEVESRTLDELYDREMITPKVYLEIKETIEHAENTLEHEVPRT